MRVRFTLPWVAGQSRPRFACGHAYKPDSDRMREGAIAAAFHEARGLPAEVGVPVSVEVHVYKSLPKSAPKRVQTQPNTFKPDADNVAKLVLDGLNGVAWQDDAQVTLLKVVKHERSRGCDDRMNIEVRWEEQ